MYIQSREKRRKENKVVGMSFGDFSFRGEESSSNNNLILLGRQLGLLLELKGRKENVEDPA